MRFAGPLLARVPPTALRRRGKAADAILLAVERATARWPRRYDCAETVYGFQMAGDTRDLIQRYVYIFGVWEPTISQWIIDHLRPDDVVLDIGANVGYVSLLAASRVGPSGTVFAFEPVPPIIDKLTANVVANNYRDRITIIPKIVSDSNGSAPIFLGAETNTGLSSTIGAANRTPIGVVEKVRAADAVDANLWSGIRLVKIDTEGDEFAALLGLVPILEVMSLGSAVLVEITPESLSERGVDATEPISMLTGLGFEGFEIPNPYEAATYLRPAPMELRPLPTLPTKPFDAVFVRR